MTIFNHRALRHHRSSCNRKLPLWPPVRVVSPQRNLNSLHHSPVFVLQRFLQPSPVITGKYHSSSKNEQRTSPADTWPESISVHIGHFGRSNGTVHSRHQHVQPGQQHQQRRAPVQLCHSDVSPHGGHGRSCHHQHPVAVTPAGPTDDQARAGPAVLGSARPEAVADFGKHVAVSLGEFCTDLNFI